MRCFIMYHNVMKICNNLGHFYAHMGTYGLNWARRTSWDRRDEWDDTALQTQDLKFEPRWCETEHTTSRSLWLHSIFNLYEWAGKKHFVSLKLGRPDLGSNLWSLTSQAGSFDLCTRAPALMEIMKARWTDRQHRCDHWQQPGWLRLHTCSTCSRVVNQLLY